MRRSGLALTTADRTEKTQSPALARLEAQSADLEPVVARGLDAICAEPDTFGRFLNTLSLMEHLGSRKIMASQSPLRPDQETLKHLAEETRHAFFFKRAAEAAAGREMDYAPEDMTAGASAGMYMGRLDAHIAAALPEGVHPRAAYLYMSLVVELRAVWFYRLLQSALKSSGKRLSLKSVLAEEELHLADMQERLAELDPELDARLEGFAGFEDGLFRRLWGAIEGEALAKAA